MAAPKPDGDFANGEILSLLECEDFSFHMRGWKGRAAEFFAPTREREAVLAERRRWLDDTPELYCGTLDGAGEPLAEMAALAREWTDFSSAETRPPARCLALALDLEPDFILLTPDADRSFRAIAGAVCFPSSWDFRDALGKRLHEIHAVVPGLNEAIGERIDSLLKKIPPGGSWSRLNWGVSLLSDRNQHPSRKLARLCDAREIREAWLRVELQVLHKLPGTGALLFGIRPVSISFEEIAATPAAAAALKRQLDTMPASMRDYKGIGEKAALLDRWLS